MFSFSIDDDDKNDDITELESVSMTTTPSSARRVATPKILQVSNLFPRAYVSSWWYWSALYRVFVRTLDGWYTYFKKSCQMNLKTTKQNQKHRVSIIFHSDNNTDFFRFIQMDSKTTTSFHLYGRCSLNLTTTVMGMCCVLCGVVVHGVCCVVVVCCLVWVVLRVQYAARKSPPLVVKRIETFVKCAI
jgi:hypothetical protein